jgi:multidrug efflux pump subunit AcrB
LAVVQGIKGLIPPLKTTLPPALNIIPLADQSIFVTGGLDGVARETVIAGCLTAIMILLFLGDWRSTLIIAVSIPLAILSSIAALSALGQTLNLMTLGGLALAVGILVDDATVTIENIDRHLAEGKPTLEAIRDGAAQIATPALVSTMCICIVFVPIFFLSGVAKYLFSPLAEAVIFALIASYILSRTLVPTLAMYWMPSHQGASHSDGQKKRFRLFGWAARFHQGFEHRFEQFREGYRDLLSFGLRHGGVLTCLVLGFTAVSMALVPFLGQDFFPSVDAGEFDLHIRVRSGTRIEETARSVDQIEQMIRQIIPADQLLGIIDNLGIPYSGINTSYNTTGTVSSADGDILVTLSPKHDPTNNFVQAIRARMHHEFPDVSVWFPPPDIATQILNFGLPAPIDVQITGADTKGNFQFATNVLNQIRRIPGAVDFRIQELNDAPQLNVTIDRTKASILGITADGVTQTVLGALAGSNQTAPNFWVDPQNGVSYQTNAQAPQYDMDSLDSLRNLPILGGTTTGQAQILDNVADLSRGTTSPVVDHYNIRP